MIEVPEMVTKDFSVVKVHQNLITYVDYLQKKNSEALGFYPKCVFERESVNGRIFLGLLNGEPCGYLYAGAKGYDVKCYQVCIQYDARRFSYGAALVQAMEDYADGAYTITLRCGFDLDANKFWQALGYRCIKIEEGGIRRMRKINIWQKQLIPELFETKIIEPSTGRTNSSVWRKNKKTGIVTWHSRSNGELGGVSRAVLPSQPPSSDGNG